MNFTTRLLFYYFISSHFNSHWYKTLTMETSFRNLKEISPHRLLFKTVLVDYPCLSSSYRTINALE